MRRFATFEFTWRLLPVFASVTFYVIVTQRQNFNSPLLNISPPEAVKSMALMFVLLGASYVLLAFRQGRRSLFGAGVEVIGAGCAICTGYMLALFKMSDDSNAVDTALIALLGLLLPFLGGIVDHDVKNTGLRILWGYALPIASGCTAFYVLIGFPLMVPVVLALLGSLYWLYIPWPQREVQKL